jgi:hypothetical protein
MAITVSTHPQPTSGALGATVTISAAASITEDANYHWEYSDNGSTWIDVVSGGPTPYTVSGEVAYLNVIVTGGSGRQYRCNFTAWDGSPANVITNVALVSTIIVEDGTLVDAGFEDGTDGATLSTGTWTDFLSGGNALARKEYDTAQVRKGSNSAWLQGHATSSLAGISTPLVLSADGSEIRFWVYLDTTNERRIIYDDGATAADRTWYLDFPTTGYVTVTTTRTDADYGTNTIIGTAATGWTQFQIVLDFTNQRYTVSSRTSATGTWVGLRKTGVTDDYYIPFYGTNTRSATTKLTARIQNTADLWLDDLRYKSSAIITSELSISTVFYKNPVVKGKGITFS